jgi:prepilin-type N-terminal cleavage/methylation domain-containing protein
MNVLRANYRGFTLVEMAIVLAIVALLLGGLLPTISSQVEQQHRNEARKQLDEIKESLIGYAIINGRLPWPACGNIATGQANAGIELSPASAVAIACTSDVKVLPWATLGTSETDAWGRRFTYSVTVAFTTPFTLITSGDFIVKSATGAGGIIVASSIPAVIVSHGSNGAGAYTPQGTQLVVSGDLDEKDNSNSDFTFVSHDFTPTFDDLVVWISPNILFNRMVAAGKLP